MKGREFLVESFVKAQADSMNDPRIKEMATKGYEDLATEVEEPLLEFNGIYQQVLQFYKSLPWPQL